MIPTFLRKMVDIWDGFQWSRWLFVFNWGGRLWGSDFQQRMIRQSPERYLSRALKRLGAEVADDAVIKAGLQLDNLTLEKGLTHIKIGEKAYLGPGVFLDLASGIIIEAEAVLAPQAMVLTHGDVGNRMLGKFIRRTEGPVIIKKGSWIGARAVILPGIVLGTGSVVGAGAVVTRNVADFSVVAGVPAREMKKLIAD